MGFINNGHCHFLRTEILWYGLLQPERCCKPGRPRADNSDSILILQPNTSFDDAAPSGACCYINLVMAEFTLIFKYNPLFMKGMVWKIGHRGAMGHAPENTLSSVKKALELGVDMIEIDVVTCKSGELLVFHDEHLGIRTNGVGRLLDKTYNEIRKFLVHDKEKIPTLEEVFKLVRGKVSIMLDVKSKNIARRLVVLITRYGLEDSVVVSAFRPSIIKEVKKLHPGIKTSLNMYFRPLSLSWFVRRHQLDYLKPHKRLVSASFMEQAKELGLPVYVWTLNHEEEIKHYKSLGVDGIISDYPDLI